jgi:hypothetical protein
MLPWLKAKTLGKQLLLKWWGINLNSNQKIFSRTSKIINSFPNIVSASFNLLELILKLNHIMEIRMPFFAVI